MALLQGNNERVGEFLGTVSGVYQNNTTTTTNWTVIDKTNFDIQGTTDIVSALTFERVTFCHYGTGSSFFFLGEATNETGIEVRSGEYVEITPPTVIGKKFSFKKSASDETIKITAEFGVA